MLSLLQASTSLRFGAGEPGWRRLEAILLAVSLLAALSLAGARAEVAPARQNGLIAFSTDREGDNEIYAMEADGSDQTNLTNDFGQDYAPAFSSDGTKLAFERDGFGMFTMNANGSGQTKIIYPAREPAFSPDGAKLAYDCRMDICTIGVDGSAETDLTNSATAEVSPAFSPDGTQIAFTRRIEADPQPPCPFGQCPPVFQPEVFVMNADGTDQRKLTNNQAGDFAPAFSPDGTKIAFTREVEAAPQPPCPSGQTCDAVFQTEIYVMNADGSGQWRLTNNSAGDFEPAFSPDGTKIAFASDRDDPQAVTREIYTMNADGSGQMRLTNNPADDSSPAWGTRVPPPPPPRPLPPAVTPPAALPASAATNTKVAISRRAVTATRQGLMRVNLNNANDFEVKGVLSLETVRAFATSAAQHRARWRRKRTVRLGATSFHIAAKRSVLVTIRLSRRNLRLLKHLERLRVRATATVRDPAGHTSTVNATFTLKAPVARTRRR